MFLDGMAAAHEGLPVRPDEVVEDGAHILPARARHDQVLYGHDQRRVGDDLQLVADHAGPLGKDTHAVARPRPGDVLHRLFGFFLAEASLAHLCAQPGHDVVDVHARVPGVERRHLGRVPHDVAVLGDRGEHHVAAIVGAEAEVAAADLEARRQALHVPLPRAGQRLVEVVDIEDDLTLRRAEHAEVEHVRVAAELYGEPGVRGGGEVGGHHQGGAPERRER